LKDKWIEALRVLRNNLVPKTEENPANMKRKGTKTWKADNVDKEVVESVKAESAQIAAPVRTINPQDENQQIMVAKGIWNYLGNVSRAKLQSHVICGNLNKRSKGKVKFFQTRWFIMVSGAAIEGDSEESIPETALPPWMYLNNIYYFKYNGSDDESEALGEIPTRICTLRVKDMTHSKDSGFSFLIDVGARVYHLNTDTETNLNRWVKAIEISRENAQGVSSSVTGKPKVIKKLIEMYDTQGEAALKNKISEVFRTNFDPVFAELKNIDQILSVSETMTQELISTIDGCLTARPQRLDIAECYVKAFHKRLCELMAKGWRILGSSISQDDLIKFIAFLSKYDTELRRVGVTDQKLSNGISVLALTFANRLFNSTSNRVVEIIKEALDGNIKVSSDDDYINVAFTEFCYIIEPLLIEAQKLQVSTLSTQVLLSIGEMIALYENAVLDLIGRKTPASVQFTAGVCNDSLLLVKRINSWKSLLINHLEQEQIAEYLKPVEIAERLRELGKSARNYLAETLLEEVDEAFSRPFHELRMDEVFMNIVKEQGKIDNQLDPVFSTPIWTNIMELIISKYVKCILNNKGELKEQSILLLTETMRSDIAMFEENFSSKLDKESVRRELQPLKDITDFLEAIPSQIPEACVKLRKTHGKEFNLNVARSLIELRSDLDHDEQQEALENAKKAMTVDVAESLVNRKRQSVLLSEIMVIDDKYEDKKKEEIAEQAPTLVASGDGVPVMEGYLFKKGKQKFMGWQLRFFSLKNERLYWYKNHKSYQAQNSIGLSEISECVAPKSVLPRFKIITAKKNFKLRANTVEERDKWIKAIMKEEEEETQATLSVFEEETKESLFEDLDSATKAKHDLMKSAKIQSESLPKRKKKKKPETTQNSLWVSNNRASTHRNDTSGSIEPGWKVKLSQFCGCFTNCFKPKDEITDPLLR
jgi:hypothetical protein